MYVYLYAYYEEESIADMAGTKCGMLYVLLMSGENSFGNPWRKCILKVSFYVRKILDLTFLSLCYLTAQSELSEVPPQFGM